AVDTLYRLIASDLLYIPTLKADDLSAQKAAALDYIKSLAHHNPFSSDIEETSHWYLWDISATDRCHRLIEAYGIRDIPQGELSQGLGAALHHLFAENRVAWIEQCLIAVSADSVFRHSLRTAMCPTLRQAHLRSTHVNGDQPFSFID